MSGDLAVRCRGLSVEYPGVKAVDGIELSVARGEVVALLGASGSGKSTLLHAVAGLVTPSAGEVWLADVKAADPRRSMPPERRSVGLVFQDFALWPHLNCLDTVAYPLRRAGRSRADAVRVARELLDQLGLGDLAARRPAELSGGQQQRVGLARALARDPQLFLLDEPTAHLDTHLRGAFQQRVADRQTATGAAAIYATHDAGEALAIADRVALLVNGRLAQVGTPEVVYAEPADAATAVLTGPCTVLCLTAAAPEPDRVSVAVGAAEAHVAGGGALDAKPVRRPVLVRPEWVYPEGPFAGRIIEVAFRGPHTDYRIDTEEGTVLMRLAGPPQLQVGRGTTWGLRRAWVLPGSESVDRGDRAGVFEPVVDHVEV